MTRELSVAVVGLGFGANHARVINALPGARLAAAVDRDPGRLEAAPPGAARYTNIEAMLREQTPDAVIVAVPAGAHIAVATAAIDAGCAVMVEKPLAPTYEEGVALVEAATRRGVPLMAGHIERFNPALQELARRVAAGEIGAVIQLTARRMGAIRYPPADVNVVHDSALHDIDAMRFVLGREVRSVYAAARHGLRMPVEDSIAGVLHFEAPHGAEPAIATLEVSWLSPRRVRDLAVLGEDGLFVLRYAAQSLERYAMPSRSGPVQAWSLQPSPEDGIAERIAVEPREQLVQELEAFVSAVRDGGPMPVSADDALAALRIADAITASARGGQAIELGGLTS